MRPRPNAYRLAAPALLLAMTVSLAGCGSSSNDTVSTPASTKSAAAKSKPVKFTPFSVAKYQGKFEKLASDWYVERNRAINAAMTRAEAKSDESFEYKTTDDYVSKFTEPVDRAFEATYFASPGELQQGAQTELERFSKVHHTNALVAYQTQSDKSMYRRLQVVDDVLVISSSQSGVTTEVKWHGSDNRGQNHAASLVTGVDPNSETGDTIITWRVIDGDYKIVDVQPGSN